MLPKSCHTLDESASAKYACGRIPPRSRKAVRHSLKLLSRRTRSKATSQWTSIVLRSAILTECNLLAQLPARQHELEKGAPSGSQTTVQGPLDLLNSRKGGRPGVQICLVKRHREARCRKGILWRIESPDDIKTAFTAGRCLVSHSFESYLSAAMGIHLFTP
jgi:hypothetical protein